MHKSLEDLQKELDEIKKLIVVGSEYSHFKHPDQHYKILEIGFIEATETLSIIYKAEYGNKFVWVRPVSEFLSKAKKDDGAEVDRFTKVEK